MSEEIKNYQGKTILCLKCGKPIRCRCLELDTDQGCYYFCSVECYKEWNDKQDMDWDCEFGEYEGHYYFCELGGHFKEKWKELKKNKDLYEKLYMEFHGKWKALKYPEKDIKPETKVDRMNYEPNEVDWKKGDIVIHDADRKAEHMLMIVKGVLSSGLIETRYLNKQNNNSYINDKKFLHNPRRFDIIL